MPGQYHGMELGQTGKGATVEMPGDLDEYAWLLQHRPQWWEEKHGSNWRQIVVEP